MDRKTKDNWLLISICIIMMIFAIAFIVSEVVVNEVERYEYTFSEAVDRQISNGTADLMFENGYLNEAGEDNVSQAMRIDDRHEFEFLPLDSQLDLTVAEVNQLLEGRGILEAHGEAFLNAQDQHEINVIYLISHAQVETGNGESELAQGISPDGTDATYYNFFGIGAFDSQAVEAGSSYAVEKDWSSPEDAITGGANFIRSAYLDNGQTTLYEMRWNPNNPGAHQYATDISWAESIAEIMAGYYNRAEVERPDIERIYYENDDVSE